MKNTSLPLVLLILLLCCSTAFAIDAEKLFMPGELIEGHKKYESQCKQCHVRLRDVTQKQLCMDCHKPVGKDVQKKKGFHGKNKKANSSNCTICHTDHKGRDARIIWLEKDQFDHKHTDFPLRGKHLRVECNDCHEKDIKFRDASSDCYACHEGDDSHKTKLGKKCGNCHNPKGWTSEQFDHDKTDFTLEYSHKRLACDLCHVGKKYKETPKDCVACHAIRDVHNKRFGDKCQDCHVEKKWNKTRFEHNRDTEFELKGKHLNVSCHSCHTVTGKTSSKKKVPATCYSCHRLDDIHKEKNGKQCDDCHSENSWLKTSFDHDKKTEFPLKGAHRDASCQACHKTSSKKKPDKACYSCHKHQDAHKKQQGKQCDSCHNENTWWLKDVRYDHELTNFPLIGQHAVTGCESCHFTSAFKDAKSKCNDCHHDDDIHKLALGEECQECHNPNNWLIWEFDHDQTDFKVEGAHDGLHCHRCHIEPLDKDRQPDFLCMDCHHRDDIHNGNFGSDCSKCHTQKSFSSINISSTIKYRTKLLIRSDEEL